MAKYGVPQLPRQFGGVGVLLVQNPYQCSFWHAIQEGKYLAKTRGFLYSLPGFLIQGITV
jgi:hypothetical protein